MPLLKQRIPGAEREREQERDEGGRGRQRTGVDKKRLLMFVNI